MEDNGQNRCYRANGNYVYRKIAGEGLLIPSGDLPGNVMVTMNETGGFLWERFRNQRRSMN